MAQARRYGVKAENHFAFHVYLFFLADFARVLLARPAAFAVRESVLASDAFVVLLDAVFLGTTFVAALFFFSRVCCSLSLRRASFFRAVRMSGSVTRRRS